MKLKRIILLLLSALLCFSLIASPAFAAEEDPAYLLSLSVNGETETGAANGDIITVTITLSRTDGADSSTIYAFQDEIYYDASFFELVDGGILTAEGIETKDISVQGNMRAFYINYVSFSGGEKWESPKILGTFQMKVKGESGSSSLTNKNASVSLPDGSGSYPLTVEDASVCISEDCTVTFEAGNGEEPVTVKVEKGSLLERPADPERPGYALTGWFTTASLAEEWDFENDTVKGNMTLYAGWEKSSEETDEPAATGAKEAKEAAQSSNWVIVLVIILVVAAAIVIFLFLRKGKKKEKNNGTDKT